MTTGTAALTGAGPGPAFQAAAGTWPNPTLAAGLGPALVVLRSPVQAYGLWPASAAAGAGLGPRSSAPAVAASTYARLGVPPDFAYTGLRMPPDFVAAAGPSAVSVQPASVDDLATLLQEAKSEALVAEEWVHAAALTWARERTVTDDLAHRITEAEHRMLVNAGKQHVVTVANTVASSSRRFD